MKSSGIRDMSVDELKSRERELRKELFNIEMQYAIGHLENPMRLKLLRREVARVITVTKERELEKGA